MFKFARLISATGFLGFFLLTACTSNKDILRLKDDIDDIQQQLFEIKKAQLENAVEIEELKTRIRELKSPRSRTSSGYEAYSDVEPLVKKPVIKEEEPEPRPVEKKPSEPLPEDLYDRGYELFNRERYAEAVDVFQKYLDTHSGGHLLDNARYWIGECYYAMKKYREALKAFDTVITEYPKGNKVADAYLKKGFCYFNLGMNQAALSNLQYLKENHPGTEAAEVAEQKIKEVLNK